MAIEASAILPSNSLEEFRVQFNNLVSDVDGISGGNQFVSSIVFEGSTADANETTLLATDPTTDRTITIPDVSGTLLTSGNAALGTTTTSIGDVDHVLVNDGGVLKKITAANLVAGTASPVAADNVTVGDAAVSIATSAGNITVDAQGGDTDIIFKGTDGSSDITALTLDMSDAGKAIFNGAISATTITLSADGGVIVPDNGNVGSASSTAAMQIASTGIVTFVDDILIKDGGTIGVASSTSAITISSAGIVTLIDDLLIKDGGTIGVASATTAMTISSAGIVTFVDDIVVKDAGTIGSASAPTAIGISSGGIVTLVDDLLIKDGGTIGAASATTAITIASSGIVTLVDDLILKDAATIGVTSAAGAITIASSGIVTFADDILIKDGGTIGAASATTAITIASSGIVTLVDDLILKDAATIGVTSSTSAITIASTGIVTLVDDLILKDAATIGVTSSTSAITIASTGIVTLADDLLLKDVCTIGTATTAGAISIAADGLVNLATAAATVNGAVIKAAGKESIWVPAAAMYPSTTNPCADLVQVETTALRPDLKVLDFATGADDFAQFSIAFPKSWNEGTVTFQPFWTVTGTNTGTVAWGLGGIAVTNDATINTAFGTAAVTTALAHSGTSNDLMVSVESGAITIAGSPSTDDVCFFQVNRDVSADNQSGDARLIGIKVFFTTDAANDG